MRIVVKRSVSTGGKKLIMLRFVPIRRNSTPFSRVTGRINEKGAFFYIAKITNKNFLCRKLPCHHDRQIDPLNGKNRGILNHYLLAGYFQEGSVWHTGYIATRIRYCNLNRIIQISRLTSFQIVLR
jgi:hypothetical protein